MVEGYGLANRTLYRGGGVTSKYFVHSPKRGKYALKTYGVPILPSPVFTTTYHFFPHITRISGYMVGFSNGVPQYLGIIMRGLGLCTVFDVYVCI